MRYALLIQSGAENRAVVHSALQFARALLEVGHSIERVFFYGAGVTIANGNAVSSQDERHLPGEWHAFIIEHQLDAVVCIATALQRGVLDSKEASRYGKPAGTLMDGFTLSGLGQAVEMLQRCDRVISF